MATTQIVNRQIADGAIDNNKVAAGAGIASSKLADGGNFVKKDGSVVMTGALDVGSQKITNLQTGTNSGDAVNLGQLNSALSNLNSLYKYRNVRAATTGNITLSGEQTIDGVSVVAGDRVLVKNQSTQSQNGIYVCASGAWSRAGDADAWAEYPGSLVSVNEGTTNADTKWFCPVNDGGTLGSTSITYTQDTSSGLSNSNFVDKETPSGTLNGSNTDFTLANSPVAGSEHVFLNGILQESGSGNDYTISGAVITFLTAPLSGEKIRVSYRK